jgi:ferredoxin
MLLTPEYGPRIMLASVITDAPLEPDGAVLVGKVCTKCNACVEECPAAAISDENYPPYNFERNRCYWGVFGGVRALEVDTPPLDWSEAKPNALKMVPEYKRRNPSFKELLDWDDAIGMFPKCTRCLAVCPTGIKEE